jgi:uncharacterized protein
VFFDPLYYLIAIPGIVLMFWAQFRVRRAYGKYSKVRNYRNITGAQAARALLDAGDLRDIPVERTGGELSDHYDPASRVLRLSESVYGVPSVAALGIAAHEVGHAYQHADATYWPMKLRAPLLPVANIGSNLGIWMVIIGSMISVYDLIMLGIVMFTAAVAFTILTLPIELNASNRARTLLTANGLVSPVELDGASAVLNAAAWTYVASMVQSILTLLYLVLRFTGIGRSDD